MYPGGKILDDTEEDYYNYSPLGAYRQVVWGGYEKGFHTARQNDDGTWLHKPGIPPAELLTQNVTTYGGFVINTVPVHDPILAD